MQVIVKSIVEVSLKLINTLYLIVGVCNIVLIQLGLQYHFNKYEFYQLINEIIVHLFKFVWTRFTYFDTKNVYN